MTKYLSLLALGAFSLPFLLLLSSLSIQKLLRLFIFIAIVAGFLRRVLGWLGLGVLNYAVLAILPIISLIILLRIYQNNYEILNVKKLNLLWYVALFLVLIGSIFPLVNNVSGEIISISAFLPMTVLFLLGRRSIIYLDLRRILLDIALCAILDAIYSLIQFSIGFPQWDAKWITTQIAQGFSSLGVDGAIRPFGFLTSPAESASLLALGFFAFLELAKATSNQLIFGGAAFVCFVALLTSGVRTSILLVLAVVILLNLSVQRLARILYSGIGVFGAAYLLGHFLHGEGIVARTITALKNPFALQTVQIRTSNSEIAFSNLPDHPIGFGLNSLVNGSVKFSGNLGRATDVVFADGANGLGYLGVLLAVFLVLASLINLMKFRSLSNNWVIIVPILQLNYLLNPNHYAITPVAWLCLGIGSSGIASLHNKPSQLSRA